MCIFVYLSLAITTICLCIYIRNMYLLTSPNCNYDTDHIPQISVLIPARNEAKIIKQTIDNVRASRNVDFELIICDDHSTDGMGAIVQDSVKQDPRVRSIQSELLPDGWAGKQFACHQLALESRYPIIAFIDADVLLEEDGLASMAGFLTQSDSALVSGIPYQETGSLLELMVIPLIHWLLLCHLPMWWMRKSNHQRYGAGCGQWFMTYRDTYMRIGGHETIKSSYHDGVQLPRSFRRAGYKTDICDATSLANCRMYHNNSQLWFGFAKNAREGLAEPNMIIIWTIILVLGYLSTIPLLLYCIVTTQLECGLLILLSYIVSVLPRLHAAYRFSQSWWSALFHPLGVAVLLAIQWYATLRTWFGSPIEWKGRPQPNLTSE